MTTQSEGPYVECPNRIQFGRYILERKIARGGMAELFLGREQGASPDSPYLIIKCILQEITNDPQFLAMFINEAQLAAQMNHPNIVRVSDFGEHDGRLFMVMEFVEGLDCWRFSRRIYPWGNDHTGLAVWLVCNILDGLAYVHQLTDVNGRRLNVVHRDISPSNIYISRFGDVKISDFGIARIDSARYRPVAMIPRGKFGYMAPEQVEGKPIDHRADLFSVGVVLAELLIGKKIFAGHSQLSVLLDIKDARVNRLEQNAARVDPTVLAVLHRALAKNPEDRFNTATEFRDSLISFLKQRGDIPTAKQLAIQVRRALGMHDPKHLAPDRIRPSTPASNLWGSSSAEELENNPPFDVEHYSSAISMEDFKRHTTTEGTPVTLESTPNESMHKYRIHWPNGEISEPQSFARVIEMIYTDRIEASTLIAVADEDVVRADQIPDLSRHLPAYTPTRDIHGIDKPNRRGVLELESSPEILLSLAANGETGMFLCQTGAQRKEVYFREGRVVYVTSNESSQLLGEHLVANGIIDRNELDMALDALPKFNGFLGDALIALGLLSPMDLLQQIENQICQRLEEVLAWQTGRYEFYKNATGRPNVLEVSLNLYEIVRKHLLIEANNIPIQDIQYQMEASVVSPSQIAAKLHQQLSFGEPTDRLVRSLDAPIRIGDWLAIHQTSTADDAPIKTLYLAIETGMWALDGATIPWRQKKHTRLQPDSIV